jgi:hypothetical protein
MHVEQHPRRLAVWFGIEVPLREEFRQVRPGGVQIALGELPLAELEQLVGREGRS